MKYLEKRAADRPQTALDLVHALDQISTPSGGTVPTTARPAYTAPVSATVASSKSSGRWIAAAVVIVAAAIGGWFFVSRASGRAVRSIAVLPIDVGADTAHAYLSDGLSNELTARLTKIAGLDVRAYSSSKAMRGRSTREAGKALSVGSVLSATMTRAGSRLRITASLVRSDDDHVIWSDTFEEGDQDQFALQDKLVNAITSALKLTLTPETQKAIVARGTKVDRAHELVLRSRYEADRFSEPSLRLAVNLAEQAIKLDSSYADAWAALSDAWGQLADDFVTPREATPHMERAIKKVLELDPALAEGHAQNGTHLLFYQHDIDGAGREFERALQIDSTNLTAGTWYRYSLDSRQLHDSALAVSSRAARHNPLSRLVLSRAYGVDQFKKISADSGRAFCTNYARLSADGGVGCEMYRRFAAGDRKEALTYYKANLNPTATGAGHADRARRFLLLSDTISARAELERALSMSKTTYVRPDAIAFVYHGLGEREREIAYWLTSIEDNNSDLLSLMSDDAYSETRKDPRIQAAFKKYGIKT